MTEFEHPGPYRGKRSDYQKLSEYWAQRARHFEAENARLLELAQGRQIEANVWRGRLEEAEREITALRLSEREVSCVKWAIPIIRHIESDFPEQAGIREGEAMSDVLAGLVARSERVLEVADQ